MAEKNKGETPPTESHREKPPEGRFLSIAELTEENAKLKAQLAEQGDGRKTTRGLTPSIQALATIDTALRKLKGEDAAAVQRVVAWIAQEWLPANKPMTDKPGG